MNQVKLWIALVLVVLVAVILLQNREPVETRLLFATLILPHAILLFLTAAAGFVMGSLFTIYLSARGAPRRIP